MLRSVLPLLLVLAAAPLHAQSSDAAHAPAPLQSAVLRQPSEPRLTPPAQPEHPLASRASAATADRSHWKAGAITGGILGGAIGFALGYGMDNIINEGEWSVGANSVGGALLGVAGGALLGAGIGSLVGK